jgi:hypothetical protein
VVLANSKDVEMGRGSGSTAQMEEKPMAMPLQTIKKRFVEDHLLAYI